MINKIKNIISNFLNISNEKNIFFIGSSHLALAKFNYGKITSLEEVDFKIYSQFGEDGIIDFLLFKLNIIKPKFIEIGVGDYRECNTRYIFEKNICQGMIIDKNQNLKKKVSKVVKLWKGDLTIVEDIVSTHNILQIMEKNNFEKNIDLFSLDIDGNDYWIVNTLPKNFSKIVVLEYNALFGDTLEITTPYDENFDRKNYHYSNLCFGASLRALITLMNKKNFIFLGTNIARNNAFFVNKDEIKKFDFPLPNIQDLKKYTVSYIRESRSTNNNLNYLSHDKMINEIKNCEVIDVSNDNHQKHLFKDLIN